MLGLIEQQYPATLINYSIVRVQYPTMLPAWGNQLIGNASSTGRFEDEAFIRMAEYYFCFDNHILHLHCQTLHSTRYPPKGGITE